MVIEAGRAERQYWRDLWRYRELLFFLAWRDVSVRYKQTAIGIAWAVIRPLVTLPVLVALMVWYGTVPTWRLALFPAFVFLALACALAVGLWLSALNVKY